MLFVAVTKGENRRENESPTGTGSQCKQGKCSSSVLFIIIFMDLI